MNWFEGLCERVEEQGQRPHVLASGDGRLLVTEHGARVLACELPGVGRNVFFHTDATDDGKVTGGDRLWMGPEVAYFWPTLDDALRDPKDTAVTPSTIDPGEWEVVAEEAGTSVELATEMKLEDRRNQTNGIFTAERSFRCLASVDLSLSAGLAHVAFSTRHTISEVAGAGSDEGLTAGAWSVLQVPPTGTLICPVTRRLDGAADIRSYYDAFGDRHVVVDDRCVRFLVDGKHRIKMGIKPEHTTGRMGFYRPPGSYSEVGMSSLIVRIFSTLPGEAYCDVPRDDARHRELERGEIGGPVLGGDCLQAYNDDGSAFAGTTFGEMEYHDPCVVVGCGPTARTGSCVTHVVAGADEAVRAFGEEVLGVAVSGID